MAAVNTTTTVVTTTNVNNGFQLIVDTQANTTTVGNFVTDVSIQPYIANRIISFFAYGMRPNQTMHIFFDSVLVDQYCAPGIVPDTITDTSDYTSIQINGNWGDAIKSDSTGRVAGWFNIPAAKFKTGDRILEITDVNSLALGNNAFTTIASATFTASNLSVTKQAVTLTTVNPEINFIPVTNTVITTNTTVVNTAIPDIINVNASFHEPIAQSLTINTPQNEAGIFATSLDVFFKQKAQTNEHGITIYLCEINNGYPDGSKVLPFSRVHVNYADVNVSDDSSLATNFKFESPVFLANGKQYAFIVKPDSNDPDYYVFSANLGDSDLQSGFQVFSQPTIGTAFFGSTETEWTALQTEYIKFKLYRADFSTTSGTAVFNNTNTDFISIYNVSYVNTTAGILAGDYAYQSTNSWSNSTGGTVNTSVYGLVDYYNPTKNILYVANSSGNFLPNTYIQIHRFANTSVMTPNNLTYVASGNTGSFVNPAIDALVAQFATLTPPGTTLNYSYSGTSNTYTRDTANYKINPGYETEFFDKERIVASRSNEVSNMGSAKSMYMNVDMTSDSKLLSPLIDTVRYQQLAIKNDIDSLSFNYDEFLNSGATKSKYVSQIVTLATGQDAEDISIILTAYRPTGSDIQVWVKFLNGEDQRTMTQQTWTPLINNAPNLYSDPSNPNDFREFSYSVGSYYKMLTTNGTISATSSSNVITGTATFFSTEVKPGWYINMRANSTFNETSRKIVSIASNTSLQLSAPFNGNYSGQPYFIVPPPSTAWLSTNNSTQLTGTVTTSTTNNTITGSGTLFTTQMLPGTSIGIANDSQIVVSVNSNTSITVGKPWSSNNTGANAYSVTAAGVTYLNDSLNLFSTYKQFQIKIILQSNDSSTVPLVDDLRVLALQM